MLPERFRYPPMGRRNEIFPGKPTASFTSIQRQNIVNLAVDYTFKDISPHCRRLPTLGKYFARMATSKTQNMYF